MKQFTFLELRSLEVYTLGMRICPDITFETANLINKNHFAIKKAISEYQEQKDLIEERKKEVTNDSEKLEEVIRDGEKLDKSIFNVEITELDSDLFKDVKGECNMNLSIGNINLPYREIYFTLLEKGIIK